MKRSAPQIIAGFLAVFALAACEPRPPKPKTDVETQANAEKHASAPQPVVARRPEQPKR
jgi:uncharacterized lipoprotein